jgi:endonuclease YncB( thermonuclease family)
MRARPTPWLVIALLILLAFSVVLNGVLLFHAVKGSRVLTVYDGDSFELADGRRVRLLGVDAPEKGRCGYEEAKAALREVVEGKHVEMHNIIVDEFGRMVANVELSGWDKWTKYIMRTFSRNFSVTHADFETNIGVILASRGLVRNLSVSSPVRDRLKQVVSDAKSKGLGIYSTHCNSPDPSSNCVIKGNIRQGKKEYYLPACKTYSQVIVDLSFGDSWFCSESQAEDAGFILSKTCQ